MLLYLLVPSIQLLISFSHFFSSSALPLSLTLVTNTHMLIIESHYVKQVNYFFSCKTLRSSEEFSYKKANLCRQLNSASKLVELTTSSE